MGMNLPGLGGDKPPQGREEGSKSGGNGDKRPMNNNGGNKGKPTLLVSEDTIKNSDQSQAYALMKLSWREWRKRPWYTTIFWTGSVICYTLLGGFILGGFASLFSVTLPEGAKPETQVGYIVVDAGKTVLIEGGKALAPAAGTLTRTGVDAINKVGTTLVSATLDEQVRLQEQVDTNPRESDNNGLLTRYEEVSNNGNSQRRRRQNTRGNLVRLPLPSSD